ncbi:MAG: hypothetical protein ACOYL9_13625 [Ilumatobacteraceae bacterium]
MTERTITTDHARADARPSNTVGVLGGVWRGDVSPWGSITEWDGGRTLDWYVAADDRWHIPADEATVRQSCLDGAPVVETRLRIPQGDAVQRVYAVADQGGITVIEVENDSPMPIAVAFSGIAVLTQRSVSEQPPQGIDLPAGSIVVPVGHRSTATVAIRHDGAVTGTLPTGLASALQVARGWTTLVERASRLLLPDTTLAERVVHARCQLALDGPADAIETPIEFLLGVGQLVRMGSIAADWMPEVADAVTALPRHRSDPFLATALDAAEGVCVAAKEDRALRDLAKVRAKLTPSADVPARPEGGVRLITWAERTIASGGSLLPNGLPTDWLGAPLEVYQVPTGPDSAVSFALRWHGERPAVLWEASGTPRTLSAPVLAPSWSTNEATGDALWPVPPNAVTMPPLDEDISFG